jgi:hypothetical protein
MPLLRIQERGSGAALAGGLALLIVLSYVVVYPIRGFHVAIGSDTPVYIWWARRTGTVGMRALEAGGRPLIVGLIAALADATHVPVAAAAAVIGPVLAAAGGLATAAFADLALGRDRLRFVLVALFAGGFLSLLVAGYFATLAFGALFVAGLACLAHASRTTGRLPVVAAAALLGAAGLAQPLFMAMGAALVTGGMIALVPAYRRDRAQGARRGATTFVKTGAAFAGAVVLTGLGILAIGPRARVPADTSRDAILRRVGLSGLSRKSYQRVLLRFFPLYRAITDVGLAALVLIHPRTDSEKADGATLFWSVMGAWVVVTVIGVLALWAGTSAPGQRLAAFCLAVPALAAIGLLRTRDRLASARSGLGTCIVVLGALLFLVVAWLAWGGQQPLIRRSTLAQFSATGALLSQQPEGTPLILVANDRTATPGLMAARAQNFLRDTVPPDRIPDVHVFLGTPRDFLSGRPTLTGHEEHDRIATSSWEEIRATLDQHPEALAVVLKDMDLESYTAAIRLGAASPNAAASPVAPGVLALPGFAGQGPAPVADPATGPFSAWLPVWLGPLWLLVIAVAGWPWVAVALREVDTLIRSALAPAFGIAALGAASILLDLLGIRMAHGGGAASLVLAVAAGWLTAAFAR